MDKVFGQKLHFSTSNQSNVIKQNWHSPNDINMSRNGMLKVNLELRLLELIAKSVAISMYINKSQCL